MAVTDRRAHDPFAPHPRKPKQPVPDQPPADALAGLDSMRKADLVALAEQRGLDTTGTRVDLIARIREAS